MATPTIPNGEEYFFPIIYEGNGAGQRVGKFVPFTDSATIAKSCMFNRADTAILDKTYGSAGTSRKKYTFSVWLKIADIGQNRRVIMVGPAGNDDGFRITNDNTIHIWQNGIVASRLYTNRTFEDTSKFYHFLIRYEASNGTQEDTIQIYVDGDRQTFQSAVNITDTNGNFNANVVHAIGKYQYNNTEYLDGYLAEIVWIDGTALDPSSFGEYNSSGIWVPKDVSGLTFGTNGFHIDGRDASDLGDDESGNGNDFTTSGLASHDQVLDSPTNNFCVISQINMGSATGVTLKNGGLEGTTGGTPGNMPASFSLDSGKWYWEVNNHANGSGNNFGVGETPTGSFDQFTRGSNGNTVNTNAKTTTGSSGQIIGFKLDFDAGTLTHSTDGTSYSSTGSLTADMAYAPHSRLGGSSGRVAFNFGQDSTFGGLETAGGNSDGNGVGNFYYSVPSGFLAICTKNLGS